MNVEMCVFSLSETRTVAAPGRCVTKLVRTAERTCAAASGPHHFGPDFLFARRFAVFEPFGSSVVLYVWKWLRWSVFPNSPPRTPPPQARPPCTWWLLPIYTRPSHQPCLEVGSHMQVQSQHRNPGKDLDALGTPRLHALWQRIVAMRFASVRRAFTPCVVLLTLPPSFCFWFSVVLNFPQHCCPRVANTAAAYLQPTAHESG